MGSGPGLAFALFSLLVSKTKLGSELHFILSHLILTRTTIQSRRSHEERGKGIRATVVHSPGSESHTTPKSPLCPGGWERSSLQDEVRRASGVRCESNHAGALLHACLIGPSQARGPGAVARKSREKTPKKSVDFALWGNLPKIGEIHQKTGKPTSDSPSCSAL